MWNYSGLLLVYLVWWEKVSRRTNYSIDPIHFSFFWIRQRNCDSRRYESHISWNTLHTFASLLNCYIIGLHEWSLDKVGKTIKKLKFNVFLHKNCSNDIKTLALRGQHRVYKNLMLLKFIDIIIHIKSTYISFQKKFYAEFMLGQNKYFVNTFR